MEEFVACFSEVSDPRQDNVRHNLYEVLIIALCCLLCGGEDCSDMEVFGRAKRPFLRQFLRLKHGIPSHDTFSRLFRQLDPKPFQACFVRFMERFAQGLEGVIAVDGKSLRGSFDRASGKSPLHMVHAWAVDQRLLLGQIATGACPCEGGGQIQRDHGGAQAAGDAVTERLPRDGRRNELPTCDLHPDR
jgi:hypothetical protein